MPQAVPALAAIGSWLVGGTIVANIVGAILINVALGALSKALAKKPKVNEPAINVTIRNTTENRRLVFGTQRCGGSFIYYDVSGTENKYLWYVIAYAGHQVEDIRDVWLDTQRIVDSAIGSGAPEGGAVTTGAFANKLWIYKHSGTSVQSVDTELNAAISAWTGNHRLRGTAYIIVKMEKDDEIYLHGAPQNVTALIDGALFYDPRLDSTNGGSGSHRLTDPRTWAFSRNPALAWNWFVSGGSVHNDLSTRLIKYGLRESDSRIPSAFVIAAANKCDEQLAGSVAPPSGTQTRYYCDLEVSTGETRREILEAILATMAGTHVVVHGQHRLFAGSYTTAIHTFTEADLYGQLEIEDTLDHSRRYNAVAGVFRDKNKGYVEQTTIFRTDAAYETQDGDQQIPIEIDLRGVTDPYQAQRLCEIKLRKSRMMRSVKLVGALNLLKVAQHETISFSHTRYGWQNRIFRCIEREFNFNEDAGRVSLTCEREDAAVYNDLLTADYTTGTSDTDTFQNETPNAPSDLKTSGRQNGILVEWTKPAIVFPGTTFELRMSTVSAMTSPTTVYEGPDLQTLIPRTTTADAFFQARSVRNGEESAWHPETNGVLGKASSVLAALSATVNPGSVSSSTGAANQTTASVTVTATGGTSPYTYAWTWFSGGSSITITSATSASTTFSTTGLAESATRSGVARCTVTDNVSATYTIDVDVQITRLAATVTAPQMFLPAVKFSPTNASVAFKFDTDGHWYSSLTTGSPTTDRGLWANPVDYAANYAIRITRTGGSETVFTSGPALGGSNWHAMTSDREWRLTESTDGFASKSIIFTVEFRRISDSVVVSTTTANQCQVTVEI